MGGYALYEVVTALFFRSGGVSCGLGLEVFVTVLVMW